MCRLFGFRSVIPSQVHRSLLAAENALGVQSNQHPDGWGVAFYVDGSPHITKNATTALGDSLFHRLSGVVSSETVLAHVRKATQGKNSVLNCHPFQYGRWTFAHNGDIPNFSEHHQTLRNLIAPGLRRFVLGDTDSEVLFFILLTNMSQHGPLSRPLALEEIVEALRITVSTVRSICDHDAPSPCLLTFMLTDGVTFVAARGGKELFWSTYKRRCSERNTCPSLSDECEAPSKTGYVNHFIVSSEPLQGENVWEQLEDGDVVGVDHRMRVLFSNLERTKLRVLHTA
jgi:glutamine amidotransferase